jgi:hypothetical protein
LVGGAMKGTLGVVKRAVSAFRTVLGPFAFPVFILGSLLI